MKNTMASLTTLSFPSLTNTGDLSPNTMASLTTFSFPALTTINGTFSPSSMGALANVTLGASPSTPSGLKSVGGNVTIVGNLSQASVDHILVQLAALDGTSSTVPYSNLTVTLAGGTNATPSLTGLTAKATLVARGCTVTNN